jgi:glycosyltransferase involved in cell wall biosynthesis
VPAEPLRVLLVSGPATGGIRRHLQNLLEGSSALRTELALAAPSGLLDLSDLSDARHWPLELGDRPRPIRDLAAFLALRGAVREFHPHVIHTHGVKAALVSLFLPLPAGVPVIVTLHNVWRGGRLTPLLRTALRRARAVICVSEAVRDALLHHSISVERATVIPNGVSLPPLTAREPGDRVTVAFVGRLTKEKGVDTLIDAWSALTKTKQLNGGGRFHLVIAGDGPLRPAVEQWAGKPAAEAVYLGHVESVNEVYKNADIVVIPSRSEGQSLTALEAMSYGLPVIACSVGGLREVILDTVTGLLIPPESPQELGAAICLLGQNKAMRADMGTHARARVATSYSLESMLERTRQVYEVCARRA